MIIPHLLACSSCQPQQLETLLVGMEVSCAEKNLSVHMYALEPQIHPLDFQPVHEICPLKSLVGSENTL